MKLNSGLADFFFKSLHILVQLNFRILHLASSRELVYSYQPDEVSDWTELARVNLSTGAVSGQAGNAPLIGQLTGQLPSSGEKLFFGVDIDKYSTVHRALQFWLQT